MQSLARFEELRLAYEIAFERLCDEVRKLNSGEAEAQPELVAESRLRVQDAEEVYRRTRDALAQFLIDHQSKAAELGQVA